MKYGLHLLCIQNDFCLEEGIREVLHQADQLKLDVKPFIVIPSRYRDGSPCDEALAAEVVAIASRNEWAVEGIDNTDWVCSDLPRWAAEAALRSEAVRRIRDRGFNNILVLDTDELWSPGCLRSIHTLASVGKVKFVYNAFLPVIGIPGYPIEGARDEGLTYMDSALAFQYSRSVRTPGSPSMGLRWARSTVPVFHFTMVRKKWDAVLHKVDRSSHYKEKHYDYETWVKETLPKIHPGMVDVSFFKDPSMPQFWPVVREFSEQEWLLIPDTLKPYLSDPRRPI